MEAVWDRYVGAETSAKLRMTSAYADDGEEEPMAIPSYRGNATACKCKAYAHRVRKLDYNWQSGVFIS